MAPDNEARQAHDWAVNLPPTLSAWQGWARAHGLTRLDVLVLAEHLCQRPRTWLLAHDDAPWPRATVERMHALLERRRQGVPVAYLTGQREFFGLVLEVTPDVLVPRPETELLVEWALELLVFTVERTTAPRVVDLGTGSGAIALALKHASPSVQVHGVDASEDALKVARRNAQRLALDVSFSTGHWWQGGWAQALGGPPDLVVANPPYLADDDPHLPALCHEPRTALVAQGGGLADLEAIVEGAAHHLLPGAWVLLEHGHTQGDQVRRLLTQGGFVDVCTRTDLAGHARCSAGRRPPPQLG